MEHITTKKLKELRSNNADVLVLNVLARKYYDEMHLPNSESIPVDDVEFVSRVRNRAGGDETVPIVVYCADESCPKSEFAAERLEAAGFQNVYDYVGGVQAWRNEDLPLEGSKASDNGLSGEAKTSGKQMESSGAKESPAAVNEAQDERGSGSESSPSDQDDAAAEDTAAEDTAAEDTALNEDASAPTVNEASGKDQGEAEDTGDSSTKRTASAVWQGMLKDGSGHRRLGSVSGIQIPFSFATRFEKENGNSPEELLGAGLAACYSMALAAEVGRAGYASKQIETRASTTAVQGDGAYTIDGIDLQVTADLNGIESDAFQDLAKRVKDSCPVAQALDGVEIRIQATLSSRTSD